MSIARSYSAQLNGLKAEPITIEVDISNGLHSFSIVGLGDRSIEEARDRISAALKNSGFISPKQKNQKVIISLAPADIRKEGPSFDLGMTMTYLLSSNQIKYNPEKILFLGELSLEGKLRRVVGILPILCQAKEMGFEQAFMPYENYKEASLARDIAVYPASSLQQITAHLSGIEQIRPIEPRNAIEHQETSTGPDLASVRGNETAKRGLEIAAAGAHNLVLYGPPGTGKSLLAKCLPSILPNLDYEESVEVTSLHSISQNLDHGFITRPPFRSPHHTASYPAIVGGGTFPKPGEVTLAHRGVLFLDEFPEFARDVIEALRQPLEDRAITISRAKGVVTFPAQCILVASMNPCPCGMGKEKGCTCTAKMLKNYENKISGPIADRVDIWLNIDKVDYKKLGDPNLITTTSESIKKKVEQSRKNQFVRFQRYGIKKKFNSEMSGEDTEKLIKIESEARNILITSAEKLGMSGRAFHRTLKVAQTIADLSQNEIVTTENILEAIQYRDRRRLI